MSAGGLLFFNVAATVCRCLDVGDNGGTGRVTVSRAECRAVTERCWDAWPKGLCRSSVRAYMLDRKSVV